MRFADSIHPGAGLRAVRRALGALLGMGLVGTGTELLLMGHTDGAWQLVPVVLIGLSLPALLWYVGSDRRAARVVLIWLMVMVAASGGVGLARHYIGNMEFARELTPGISGRALFAEAMTGATPTLAPGAMTLIGLVGLVYVLSAPTSSAHHPEEPGVTT